MLTKVALYSPVSTMEEIYVSLAVLGLVVPYALVILFLDRDGPNVRLFAGDLFGNYAGSLAMADLLLSSIAFWFWLFSAGQRNRVRFRWIYVVLNLTVGLCFALPMVLYVRSRSDRRTSERTAVS